MFEIDSRRAALKNDEAEMSAAVKKAEAEIEALKAKKAEFDEKYARAKNDAQNYQNTLDEELVETYLRLKNSGKKFPLVVKLSDDKCGACFIRVSSSAREITAAPSITTCEHCGRILYV